VPRLVHFIEQDLSTDFAILRVGQEHLDDGPGGPIFASSIPGAIGMMAGTKYAQMHVRIERWDGRPPEPSENWEDLDELPWLTVAGAGDITASEFDPPRPGPGLSVAGLTAGRAQVLAAGRHRYDYSDLHDEGFWGPEQWLVRIWPTDLAGDGLSGTPRRIAGPSLGNGEGLSGWHAAFRGWHDSGWHSFLLPVDAFGVISQGLSIIGRPCTAEELEAKLYSGQPEQPNWASPIWPRPLVPGLTDHMSDRLALIGQAASMEQIRTYGDALTCLRRLGLLAVLDGEQHERLTINAAPENVGDVVAIDADLARGLKMQALASRYRAFDEDVLHMVRWAPDETLVASPYQLAVRLSLSANSVVGALQLLQLQQQIEVDRDLEDLEPQTEIVITRRKA
jgi:hypothetical protein